MQMSDRSEEQTGIPGSASPPCYLTCPQCAAPLNDVCELMRNEGVCISCCEQNQFDLDEHNWLVDWWDGLNYDDRESIIRAAIK
jgi:hypothetical protein